MVVEKIIISIFLPFISSFISGVFGRFCGRKGCSFLVVIGMGLSFYFFVAQGLNLTWSGSTKLIILTPWIFSSIDWALLFDQISLEMCMLITSITFCVLLYSTEYMYHDPHIIRFLSLLSLFAFFMIILVTSSSFIQMFVGWEGVGFVSFLLINFWFMRLEANRSAVKAMLFNRIGDSFYLLGLIFLFIIFKTTDIVVLNSLGLFISQQEGGTSLINLGSFSFNFFDLILLLFFLAAVGKSAQLGLHAWLPDAMEGPTPVSSLLHSATMVTAGVFLLIRLSPIFSFCTIIPVLVSVGALTAFLNAFFGFLQNDLKKIIAFSTCSQLGMMVVAVFYNAGIGFYHLVNHGFFKALLFLSAGSVIHAVANEQDIRKMGGLVKFLPFTGLCMFIGNLAIVGYPFLSGFYSKELILFNVFGSYAYFDHVIFLILALTSMFTILYSIKIMKKVFFNPMFFNSKFFLQTVHEPKFAMFFPMFVLGLLAILFGFFNEELFFSIGSAKWEPFLGYPTALQNNFSYRWVGLEMSSVGLKWFLIFFFLLFLKRFTDRDIKLYSFFVQKSRSKFLIFFFWTIANKLGFISLYRILATIFYRYSYRYVFLLLDRGFFEMAGPTKLVRIFLSKKTFHETVFVSLFNLFIFFSFSVLIFGFLFFVKFSLLLFLLFLFISLFV